MYYFSRTEIKFDLGLKFIFKSLFASFVMSFLIFEYNPTRIINVLISTGFATGVYFGILLLLKGFSKDELKFFKSLFKISKI